MSEGRIKMLPKKVRDEIDKISQMDREQKWSYFKTYYLKASIICLICLVCLIWFIKDTVFQKEYAIAGCVYGTSISYEQKEMLTSGYLERYGFSKNKYQAAVATDNMFEGTAQQMDANSHEMALFAQIAAGEIYYLILDEDMLLAMQNGGIYASLSEVLSEATIEKLGDAVVCLEDSDTGVYEGAVDLKKVGFFTEDNPDGYLVFTIAKPYPDFQERLTEYIIELSNN